MKLSIITINYNNLEGLKKTYESVVNQTWTDYEWIVIDGGSTDGSREFIVEHQNKFAFWCSEPDKGVYNAMNKGIAKAQGDYLNFMNSGDCFAFPTTLKLVFSEDHKADIFYGYMMRRTLDGMPHNIPSMKPHLYWEDFYFDTLPHQSSFIKRDLFKEMGGYDESYPRLADWKWFLDAVVYRNVSVEFIPHKLSVYECGGISEDEHWKEDIVRLRKEKYAQYIPLEDYLNLRDLHKIMECRWTLLLYRVVRKLSRIRFQRMQKRNFNTVRFNEKG